MAIRPARRTLLLEQSYYVRLAEQSLMLIFSWRFVVRAQQCCAPTCVPHLPEKRCMCTSK